MKTLKFRDWAKSYGIKRLAKETGVCEHQVRKWMNGKASPRAERLLQLVKLSKGELLLSDIILETSQAK